MWHPIQCVVIAPQAGRQAPRRGKKVHRKSHPTRLISTILNFPLALLPFCGGVGSDSGSVAWFALSGVGPARYSATSEGYPLTAVKEIHVSGADPYEDCPENHVHKEMEGEDYKLLEEVLPLTTGCNIVTLEYGGTGAEFSNKNPCDPDALMRQLKKLRRIVDKYNRDYRSSNS